MDARIQNGIGSWPDPLPLRVYPGRTKRCGGSGLVTKLQDHHCVCVSSDNTSSIISHLAEPDIIHKLHGFVSHTGLNYL